MHSSQSRKNRKSLLAMCRRTRRLLFLRLDTFKPPGSLIDAWCGHRTILGSPHNPKFLWADDAEIVGDRITEARPVPGNFFTQETERRISELGACCVAFVVRDVSVHEAPQPLDRIEMRAIGRDEMQLDPAPGSSKPFLHQPGVMSPQKGLAHGFCVWRPFQRASEPPSTTES